MPRVQTILIVDGDTAMRETLREQLTLDNAFVVVEAARLLPKEQPEHEYSTPSPCMSVMAATKMDAVPDGTLTMSTAFPAALITTLPEGVIVGVLDGVGVGVGCAIVYVAYSEICWPVKPICPKGLLAPDVRLLLLATLLPPPLRNPATP